MKNLFLISLSLVLLVSCDLGEHSSTQEDQSGWANVQFKGTNYDMKLEQFDPPVVFEWGSLITDHEPKDWFNLYRYKGNYHWIDRGEDQEQFVSKLWSEFEPNYFEASKEDEEREKLMRFAQSMTFDEYREKFPFRRYYSVYATISVRNATHREWIFALQQNSANEYMRSFPSEGLEEELAAQASIFARVEKRGLRYATTGKPDVPIIVKHMNINDLDEIEEIIESGEAVLPKGEIWIKAAEPQETL